MRGLAMAAERHPVQGDMVKWPSTPRIEDCEMIKQDLVLLHSDGVDCCVDGADRRKGERKVR